MKLIFAIVHNEDAPKVISVLNSRNISVTRLSSTGGFLRSGNTTLLIGVNAPEVDSALEAIEKNSRKRTETLKYPIPAGDFYIPSSKDIQIGGATIFIINAERFEKL